MSVNINKVFIGGRLIGDPVPALEGKIAKFTIAINRKFNTQQGPQEETTFVDCEAGDKQAPTILQYLTKGRAVLVEGRLRLQRWQSKDGEKKSRLSVRVDHVSFLDAPTASGEPQAEHAATAANADEEPPF